MNKFYKLLSVAQIMCLTVAAQTKSFTITENVAEAPKANYQLAAKYSPTKLKKMIYSTTVDPHWLKLSHRFWYQYETPSGKQWYIVDPVTKIKKTVIADR